ncbi:MAG: hypothetical protein LBS63_03235 [Prevotellaceae bacterium]|nr:hypothetical protein [Prevotellaceae bacterium]
MPVAAHAQGVLYKAEVRSFFDNTEFGTSNVQMPQTMAGTHLAPEVGMGWGEQHRIFVGLDAMHEWGSNKAVDFFDPIAYYQFSGKLFRAYVGAFPRSLALGRYPRMFFQDSVLNYRPIVNGVFWELLHGESYLNLWLDWASRQAPDRHEAFFMGWSARCSYGVLYAQHFGYMFHFAGTMHPIVDEGLHDNGVVLTSLGVDFADKAGIEKLEANLGWSVGLERDRSLGEWHRPQGVLSEIRVEYKGVGAFNTYYNGGSQQVFYSDHASDLYWGDPIYRSREYNRTDFYINFVKTDVVHIKLIYSLHFTEQTAYHEQGLQVTFALDNFSKKKQKGYEYIWDRWMKHEPLVSVE